MQREQEAEVEEEEEEEEEDVVEEAMRGPLFPMT